MSRPVRRGEPTVDEKIRMQAQKSSERKQKDREARQAKIMKRLRSGVTGMVVMDRKLANEHTSMFKAIRFWMNKTMAIPEYAEQRDDQGDKDLIKFLNLERTEDGVYKPHARPNCAALSPFALHTLLQLMENSDYVDGLSTWLGLGTLEEMEGSNSQGAVNTRTLEEARKRKPEIAAQLKEAYRVRQEKKALQDADPEALKKKKQVRAQKKMLFDIPFDTAELASWGISEDPEAGFPDV